MGKRASSGSVIESKYRLERELGAGGMGSVWLATQLMVDRPVAVKLLHPAFVDQEDLQARFEVEAKAIGRLNHPNVITLYDFGFSEDLKAFYTVIEYIDGESLDKRLDRRLPLTEIVSIIRQVALALDHAHHHSILHRDLKPENVMLAKMTDGSEMVKVLDFGIARIVKGTDAQRTEESHRITKAGEVFGTPAYMSPEQARSVRQLEAPADLYSLGVMFYELIAGGLPFFAHSAFDLLMLHVTKPVPPIRREDVPEDLKHIVYKLLEKAPEQRFQSGKTLVEALDALDLPDEDPVALDDLETGPTIVQQTPQPTIGTPPPGMLGSEETNPESPGFSLPTPSSDVDPETQRRPTMLLDSEDPNSAFSTGSFTEPNKRWRLLGVVALGLVAVIVAVIVAVALSESEPDEASAEPAETTVADGAEVLEPDEPSEPAELAGAIEKEAGADEVAFPSRTDDEPVVEPIVEAQPKKKKQDPVEATPESEPDTADEPSEETETDEKDTASATKRTRRPRRRPKKKDNDVFNVRLRAEDEKKEKKSSDGLNIRIRTE